MKSNSQLIYDVLNRHLVLRNGSYVTNASPYRISKEIQELLFVEKRLTDLQEVTEKGSS